MTVPIATAPDRLWRTARFLWSGWAGVAGLSLFAALWQAGHEAYGTFILPSPAETLRAALEILSEPGNWATAGLTASRALQGFALSVLAGAISGIAVGYSAAALRLAKPLLTVVLGVPPIAWIVLAMIWFGSTDGTALITVMIAVTPLVFAGAVEGVVTRDRGLDAMAEAFGAGPVRRFATVGLRQISAHLFPAVAIALGRAFKVAVMAELLANIGGVGGALASARANLDMAEALAWVLIAVGGLIAAEYGVLHPLRSEFERWREAARPWGVKR